MEYNKPFETIKEICNSCGEEKQVNMCFLNEHISEWLNKKLKTPQLCKIYEEDILSEINAIYLCRDCLDEHHKIVLKEAKSLIGMQ